MRYVKTLYGTSKVKNIVPFKNENKAYVRLFLEEEEIINGKTHKIVHAKTFVVDLLKIENLEEIDRIEFFYKRKGYPKEKVAELILKSTSRRVQ